MRVAEVDQAEAEAWDAFVRRAPAATFYHQYRWRHTMTESYGTRTHYLAATGPEGIRGILPLAECKGLGGGRTLVSLPYSNYAGIVADDAAARDALIEEARRRLLAGGCDLLELKQDTRCDHPDLQNRLDYHALAVELDPDPDVVWRQRLTDKARNQVRKARRGGLTAEVGPHLFSEFIALYRHNLRDLGTPAHARRWFDSVQRHFGDDMDVVIVRQDQRAIAGGWFLYFKDTAIMQAGASLKAYLPLCPNNLAYWTAIEHVCRRGCRQFDFARSRIGAGTHHFKRQWGAVPRQTHYQYLLHRATQVPDMDPHNPKYRLMIAAWQRLPLWVANGIGPVLRKRITT